MPRKMIFLMGAPSGRLQWDDQDLLDTAVPPFKPIDSTTSEISRKDTAKWRVLEKANKLEASAEDTVFLDTANLSFKMPRKVSDDVLRSQFYEHSLSLLGGSYSESDSNDTTSALEDSYDIDESVNLVAGSEGVFSSYIHELHDIKDIPNAAYLQLIIPQTPSVTLVVAVIGINPLRRVTARQSKQELDILELIVGDETRAGFCISFWLPVPTPKDAQSRSLSESNSDFRQKICGLRPRDIVLMRNVGLSSLQDRVYGQSLRRGLTKVDLLHRERSDSTDVHGRYSTAAIDAAGREDRFLCKVRNVRDWLVNFVGTKADYDSHNPGQPLPPDTQ